MQAWKDSGSTERIVITLLLIYHLSALESQWFLRGKCKKITEMNADSTRTQKIRILLTKSEQNRQQSLLAFSEK